MVTYQTERRQATLDAAEDRTAQVTDAEPQVLPCSWSTYWLGTATAAPPRARWSRVVAIGRHAHGADIPGDTRIARSWRFRIPTTRTACSIAISGCLSGAARRKGRDLPPVDHTPLRTGAPRQRAAALTHLLLVKASSLLDHIPLISRTLPIAGCWNEPWIRPRMAGCAGVRERLDRSARGRNRPQRLVRGRGIGMRLAFFVRRRCHRGGRVHDDTVGGPAPARA